jgi:hypothetical protein
MTVVDRIPLAVHPGADDRPFVDIGGELFAGVPGGER